MRKILSVVVPTRNRQHYAAITARDLVAQKNPEVEIIVVDNSDDSEKLPTLLQNEISTGKIHFISSTPKALTMVDNWNRGFSACNGEWISFIGDDDMLDLELTKLITSLTGVRKEFDALNWSRVSYPWPCRQKQNNFLQYPLRVNITNELIPWKPHNTAAIFQWTTPGRTAGIGLSIYHGALKRSLIEEILKHFGSPLFQNLNLDYEIGLKAALVAKGGVYCSRPFSIMGSCASSASATVNEFKKMVASVENAENEYGIKLNYKNDSEFPFSAELGLPATVAQTHLWFKDKYKVQMKNSDIWKEGFVKKLTIDCESEFEKKGFELKRETIRKILTRWEGGKYLNLYNPTFKDPLNKTLFKGVDGNYLYIDGSAHGHKTPYEVMEFLKTFILKVECIGNPAFANLPTGVLSKT